MRIILGLVFSIVFAGASFAQGPTLVWEAKGLARPESVVHDPATDVLYVSNINGAVMQKDGNGFISRLKPDGTILERSWVTGFNSPTGLGLRDRTLYVADVDALVEVNAASGAITKRHKANGAIFLNDVVVAEDGAVYVSDTPMNTIWRLKDGAFEQGSIGNALLWVGDRLLAGAVGADNYGGKVHVYAMSDAGELQQERTLLPFDAAQYAQFGAALYAAGDRVWVSSPGANAFQGRIYSFHVTPEGEWTGVEKLGADDLRQGAGFGNAAAVAGALAAVGVTGADFGVGAVKVLERTRDGWRELATLAGEVHGLDPIVGGQVDCTGGTAASLFPCQDVELLSFLPVQQIGAARGVEVNDVWGWTDPQSGREYAIVGRYDGTSFIDAGISQECTWQDWVFLKK